MISEEDLKYYRDTYVGHSGPNDEKTGDYVICIDSQHTMYLKEGKKYLILNPDGGREDVCVYKEVKQTLNEEYYSWDRFISIEEYRKQQIDKVISS